MPVDLPVRKPPSASIGSRRRRERWGTVVSAIGFAVALAESVALTPTQHAQSVPAAIFEAMLQSP